MRRPPCRELRFRPPRHVLLQVEDVLGGRAGLDGEEQHVVRGEVVFVWGLDAVQDIVLQEPGELAGIDCVAGEAVDLPAEDGDASLSGLAGSQGGWHVFEDQLFVFPTELEFKYNLILDNYLCSIGGKLWT